MSSAPRFIPHYTRDDYARWEGDWELIDGVPIAMSPSPFGPHERVVSRLSRQIGVMLEAQRCRCEVYTNLDWIVSEDTVVRPDLMVVCGEQPERHLERPPQLVVEVLSDRTRESDLTVKRELYLESGIRHYLVIDPQQRAVSYITRSSERSVPTEGAERFELQITPECRVSLRCGVLFD